MLLSGEKQSGGCIGGELIQYLGSAGHGDAGQRILMGKLEALHPQRTQGNAPAVGFGRVGALFLGVEALFNAGVRGEPIHRAGENADVPRAVAVADGFVRVIRRLIVIGIIGNAVTIPARHKGFTQPHGKGPQIITGGNMIRRHGLGIFVHDGHVHAMILPHRNPGQPPVVVVSVHNPGLIGRAMIFAP